MATTVPHGMAVTLVGTWLGIEVSSTGIPGITERRGERVRGQQDAAADQRNPYEPHGLPRDVPRPAEAVAKAPQIAYLEMEGGIVRTREILRAGVGEGRGGKGRTDQGAGREVKHAIF